MNRTTTTVVAALVLVASAAPVAAEAPLRDRYSDNMIVVRNHWFNPHGERYGGLWLLDPETLAAQRLHPFLTTTNRDQVTLGFDDSKEGALGSHEDMISYETWPARFDFDAFAWRLIRRIPTMSQPATHVGWVVQGPLLDERTADPLGLAPGVYGVARCVLTLLDAGPPERLCAAWPFDAPAGSYPLLGTDASLFLQPLNQDWVTPTLTATQQPNDWPALPALGQVPLVLSIDRGRGGFWQGIPNGVQFRPVTNGIVGEPTLTYDFTFPPFDQDDLGLYRLYYHEATDRFYGTLESVGRHNTGDERYLFRFDPTTATGELLASWVPPNREEGTPVAFTALGPPPEAHVQLVPIIGGGPGKNGTTWTTELWLYNPDDAPQDVTLRRVTQPDQIRALTIPGHGSTAITDVLSWLGAGSAGDGATHGALVITARSVWGRQLSIQGRITTTDPATGGRYGHSLAAVPGTLGYSNHVPFALGGDYEMDNILSPGLDAAHFDLDLRQPNRYRYNIGITNDNDEPVTLRLVWGFSHTAERRIREFRPPDTVTTITAPGHSVMLYAINDLFPASIRENWAPRIGVFGERPAAIWMSMVDNLTGDATFVPYASCPHYNDSDEDVMALPVVAHIPGKHGTHWQTDLYGYHSEFNASIPVVARYWPDNAMACSGAAANAPIADDLFAIVPGSLDNFRAALAAIGANPGDAYDWGFRTLIPDAIHAFDDCALDEATKGALDIATGAWYSGFSRTYTTRPDGGTYGAMLPLYPIGGWPVQHFAGLAINDEQRINLGLYNGLDQPVSHRLLLYAADGTLAATTVLAVAPHEHVQEPLARLAGALPNGLHGLTVLPLDDPDTGVEGRSWAYVSIVDNRTNDPVNLW